ncbi:AraC family transcriptional regulator [Jiangella anatolica]|uniref:AraC family transcriptional regulator n=1 Tax=Jiangella anatolica TaxID=2670374 RepID=A0A2W2C241_9ACTN|nr:AraC family transcriptional regulator [Jiangella anatolica]
MPSARADSRGHPGHALLIWVRTGTAHVRIDDAVEFRIADGEGVWIPADGWNRREIVTEPGTVAFPLSPHASVGAGAPTEPTWFDVPDGWRDWLIQHFNLMVTPLAGRGYSHDGLIDLLRRPGSRRPAPQRSGGAPSPALEPPAMPRASGARAVAEQLIRDPALDHSVEDWAAGVLASPRTLRRDFLADTGLTFEQWRLRCRLSAAVEFLAAGYGVDQVAARVGFASRNGFTRAFKQQFGPTPHEFSRQLSAHHAIGDPSQRVTAARQADDLVTMVREGRVSATAPGLLPAARTAPHANDLHVLSWVYRGSGYLDIGDRRYERRRGVATWIPAGVEHVTGLRQDSISLPLGTAGTGELRLTEPLQVQFSPAWDDYLMFCSVSARSLLRPDGYDTGHVLELFREQLAAQRARTAPMPTDRRAHAAATDFLRTVGAGDRSTAYDLPAEVHRAFRDETGMTFARWRYAARMRIARDLLAGGAKPSAVARRVGYAHLPNFSAAFSRFHGLSPREYQEREAAKR